MNLNDLMDVWRSQDAAPLHGVNDTLLRLALREDETKLKAQQRLARRITYIMSAFFVVVMALIISIMAYPDDDDVLTAWDYAIPIVGAAAGLVWAGAMHASHRAQTRREAVFGESLRDQLHRHIEQVDYYATRSGTLSFILANNLPATVWAAAFVYGILRINEKSFSDNWVLFAGTMLWSAMAMAGSVWWQRRMAQQRLLPHKRRLEVLLKQLDDHE